jgi:hypothetical protein
MLSVAVSVAPPDALAENSIEILHFLLGAMVCSEHESTVESKSPASGPAKEIVPNVIGAGPMLVTRTDFAALVAYCGTLKVSVVGETEICAEVVEAVSNASNRTPSMEKPVAVELKERLLLVMGLPFLLVVGSVYVESARGLRCYAFVPVEQSARISPNAADYV